MHDASVGISTYIFLCLYFTSAYETFILPCCVFFQLSQILEGCMHVYIYVYVCVYVFMCVPVCLCM